MNYAKIFECDTNNGEGFRVSLFVSGCNIHCKKCHNKMAQDFNYGVKYTQDTENRIINLMSKKYIRGFSLLGGEPFDNLMDDWLIKLLKRIKKTFPKKTIYCWTGYNFEDLIRWLGGSENQRYIDVQKSLKEHQIITWKRAKEQIRRED